MLTQDIRILHQVCKLSALCHDLGKANAGFQSRIQGAITGDSKHHDVVRHDLVSLILLMPMIERKRQHGWNMFGSTDEIRVFFEETALPHLASYQSEYEQIAHKMSVAESSYETAKTFNIPGFDLTGFESDPYLYGFLWLVLTHHKLPTTTLNTASQTVKRARGARGRHQQRHHRTLFPRMAGYVNSLKDDNADAFFEVDLSMDGLPWRNESWCQKLLQLLYEMSRLDDLNTLSLDKRNAFISGLLHIARPALIMGDHLASYEKDTNEFSRQCLANTVSLEYGTLAGDDLSTHLIRSQEHANDVFNELFLRASGKHDLRRVMPDECDDLSGNEAPKKYQWQNRIGDLRGAIGEDDGFIGLVTSGTGTGKTRGCLKVIREVNGDRGFRATLALGLRSLADQGYRDYQEFPIGLKSSDVGRLIGSYFPVETVREASEGTGASEYHGYTLINEMNQPILNTAFTEMITNRANSTLLPKPVTSMTIDNIIDVIAMHKTQASYLLTHLLQSDIIIDEIDNLSAEDLIFVEVLIYLFGLYGRKVVLASATLNPVIADAMVAAYRHGFDDHRALYGDKKAYSCVIGSDAPYIQLNKLDHFGGADAMVRYLDAQQSLERNDRHRPTTLPDYPDYASAIQGIRDTALRMAKQHNVAADKDDGSLRYSTGFIRFNRVDEAQRFSEFLTTATSTDHHIEVICYHSKTTSFDRYFAEYHLNNLMKRGQDGLPKTELADIQAAHQRFLERARDAGKRIATLIVCTTSIIEVGRDHDYDWAILEPASLSSYLQSIGRVLRHRREKVIDWLQPNIGVMHRPLSVFTPGTQNIWAYPGIESPSGIYRRGHFDTPEYQLSMSPMGDYLARYLAMGMTNKNDFQGLVTTSSEMLGEALRNPSNILTLRMPDSIQRLPEQSATLLQLHEHLAQGGHPLGRTELDSFNAGNITTQDQFRLQHRLGRDLKFRGGEETCQVICMDQSGDYRSDWKICEQQNDNNAITYATRLNHFYSLVPDAYYLSHDGDNRDTILEAYQEQFQHLERTAVSGLLFNISLRPYEIDRIAAFNWQIGIVKNDF